MNSCAVGVAPTAPGRGDAPYAPYGGTTTAPLVPHFTDFHARSAAVRRSSTGSRAVARLVGALHYNV